MDKCEGSAVDTGDERRETWRCPGCGAEQGYTFRQNNVTRLQLTVYPVLFTGDGNYLCPGCGAVVQWVASAAALSRLMRNRRNSS